MTEIIARKLSEIAIAHEIVRAEDYDLYIYSYQIMIERTISWTCILGVSLFFRTLPHTLLFIVFFTALHMFTGGWHASNFQSCFLSSVGVFLGFSILELFLTKWLSTNVMMAMIFVCSLVVALLGPIADPNKPMKPEELRRCRYISNIILFLEVLLSFVLYLMKKERMLVFALLSFLLISCTLYIAHHCEVKQPDC